MPVEKVTDNSGRSLFLVPFQDFFLSPQFNEEAVKQSREFPLRDDDVMLVSYPKSGCHWAWEILRILVTGSVPNNGMDKTAYMMEWNPQQDFETLPSPRVLNNHLPFRLQPADLLTKLPRVVFFYRNFKDVAVSFFHHHVGIKDYGYQGDDFGAYLQRLVAGQVESGNPFKFTREWEEGMAAHPQLPVYCCAYETMKENPMEEMRRLCKFLGKERDEAFLQEACNAVSFKTMKQTLGATKPVFYRKGQVGDWRNHFSEAQSAWFDELIKSEMPNSKLEFRYSL